MASAVYYFYKDGVYKFNNDILQKAHDFCYNTCVECSHGVPISECQKMLSRWETYDNAF
jgi:hypothetical protein